MILGRVTQVSPLMVVLKGETQPAPARAMSDFTGATPNVTEVLVEKLDRDRFAWRVLS